MTDLGYSDWSPGKPIPEVSGLEAVVQLIMLALVFLVQPLSAMIAIGHFWLFPRPWHGPVEHAIYTVSFWLFMEMMLFQLLVAVASLFTKDQ